MRRLAVIVAAFGLLAPASALASSGHAHGRAVRGKLASIDGRAKVAVLSVGGAKGRLLALDLSHTSVRLTRKHGGHKAGTLGSVRTSDRVSIKLKVPFKTALADAAKGIPAPVAQLTDERPCTKPPQPQAANPTVSGLVASVNGDQIALTFGDGSDAKTLTLDLSSAQVYAGHPPTLADASSVAVGDRVLANVSVSRDTLKGDLQAGTPVPVANLYDLGVPPADGGAGGGDGGDGGSEPVILGGTISALGSGQVTISFGDPGDTHTATLDLSSATLYAGSHAATATVTTFGSLNVGDRVYAVLSVSRETASADAQAGTPIPVVKLYDAGAPGSTTPTPPSPPSPPAPPQAVIIGGTISALGSGQVTISFGDAPNTHTATLDLSAATIYAGSHAATATVTTFGALSVGDRVYAVLSVSWDTASSDIQAGTPIPVTKLYDAGH